MTFSETCIYQVKPEKVDMFGAAQKSLYETYWKAIDKLLIVPHDKYLGEKLF